MSQSRRKGRQAQPIPVDKLYAFRAKGVTWQEQSAILKVSHSTIARWWRQLGEAEDRGEDPRALGRPPAPPSLGPGPALENFEPEDLKQRALRTISAAFESGGTEALRAAGMAMDYVRKLKTEADYFDVCSAQARAALASTCRRLAVVLQRIADPVTEAHRLMSEAEAVLRDVKLSVQEHDAARLTIKTQRAWLKEHAEDVELERLYRLAAAATASPEQRDELAAWIDARPRIMDEVHS